MPTRHAVRRLPTPGRSGACLVAHGGPHSPAAAAGPTTADPVQAGVRRVAGVAVEPAVLLVGQAPQPHSGTGRSSTAPHTSRGSTRIGATVHSSESEPHEGAEAAFAADGHGSVADAWALDVARQLPRLCPCRCVSCQHAAHASRPGPAHVADAEPLNIVGCLFCYTISHVAETVGCGSAWPGQTRVAALPESGRGNTHPCLGFGRGASVMRLWWQPGRRTRRCCPGSWRPAGRRTHRR